MDCCITPLTQVNIIDNLHQSPAIEYALHRKIQIVSIPSTTSYKHHSFHFKYGPLPAVDMVIHCWSQYSMSHTHYHYNLGEAFCWRTTKHYHDIDNVICQSTKDNILIGGGKNLCTFVLKQTVSYAASKTNQYQTPPIRKGSNQLTSSKMIISKVNIEILFNFTVHLKMNEEGEEGASHAAKRLKVQLCEAPRNEITCKCYAKWCQKR